MAQRPRGVEWHRKAPGDHTSRLAKTKLFTEMCLNRVVVGWIDWQKLVFVSLNCKRKLKKKQASKEKTGHPNYFWKDDQPTKRNTWMEPLLVSLRPFSWERILSSPRSPTARGSLLSCLCLPPNFDWAPFGCLRENHRGCPFVLALTRGKEPPWVILELERTGLKMVQLPRWQKWGPVTCLGDLGLHTHTHTHTHAHTPHTLENYFMVVEIDSWDKTILFRYDKQDMVCQ